MNDNVMDIVKKTLANVQDIELDLSAGIDGRYIYKNIRFQFISSGDNILIKAFIDNKAWSKKALSNTNKFLCELGDVLRLPPGFTVDGDPPGGHIKNVHIRTQVQASEIKKKLLITMDDMCKDVTNASKIIAQKLSKSINKS